MITPAHVQHVFASHNLGLRRFAQPPELCDRTACTPIDVQEGTRVTFLATGPNTDFVVVVLPTAGNALRFPGGGKVTGDQRQNVLLLYLRSAKTRLAMVRRIFQSI